jgi:hypothetical protein
VPVTLAKPKTQASPRAPQPAPPVRQFSFTDFQTNNPTAPPPGDRLDGEIDRANQAVADTIAWASTSLNSDGSLKPFAVGKDQLQPGLFDHVANDAEARIAPLIDAAAAAADSVRTTASEADASALAAADQNARAQDAAGRSSSDAQDAASSAAEAAQSARDAQASADAADNSANHADLAENVCIDYGVLTEAWAEHMPDTIPPNILATMDVTGDHWSSRWWANRAHEIVEQDTAQAICDLQNYWMGAYSSPPTQNTCGEPVAQGAMYYDLTGQATYVFDGSSWHAVVQPVPGNADQFLYLPASTTSIFTGLDYYGNTLNFSASGSEVLVYLNGVKQLETFDYTLGTNTVNFIQAIGPPNTVQVVVIGEVPVVLPPVPSAVKVDTNLWTFNGTTTVFTLKDLAGKSLTPPSAADCVVSLNGVIQEAGRDFTTTAGQITFTTAPLADADKWMLVGLPMQASAAAADTSVWVFDGVTKAFPIQNALGDTLAPPTATACLVSVNGVIQSPGRDFTVVPGVIQFATAPEADADAWMVLSLEVASGTTVAGLAERLAMTEARLALLEGVTIQ